MPKNKNSVTLTTEELDLLKKIQADPDVSNAFDEKDFITVYDFVERSNWWLYHSDASEYDGPCTILTNILNKIGIDPLLNGGIEPIHQIYQRMYSHSDITSINVPTNIGSINKFAFHSCKHLSNVTLNDGLDFIGYGAFENCSALKSIEIPKSVTYIHMAAFEDCSALQDVVIKGNITDISAYTFANCGKSLTIEIPKSVKYIDIGAFEDQDDVNIYYSDTMAQFKKIKKSEHWFRNIKYGITVHCNNGELQY